MITVLFVRVSELAGEIRKITAIETEFRKKNFDLTAHISVLEWLAISKEKNLTISTDKLR